MRKALNITLVIIGISASVMASPRSAVPTNYKPEPTSAAGGLHVSLPADMKSFPLEAIPLP
jgi:hypothetical protein